MLVRYRAHAIANSDQIHTNVSLLRNICHWPAAFANKFAITIDRQLTKRSRLQTALLVRVLGFVGWRGSQEQAPVKRDGEHISGNLCGFGLWSRHMVKDALLTSCTI